MRRVNETLNDNRHLCDCDILLENCMALRTERAYKVFEEWNDCVRLVATI